MKSIDFQNLVKLQAFRVTGTWERQIKIENEQICREITHEMTSSDKINRVLHLLGFKKIPKPFESTYLSILVEPIKQFKMYFFLVDRSDTNFFFYFNSQSTRLIHGEDVIGWVGVYIRLLDRAFKNIDILGIEMTDQFCFSSRVPKTKQKHLQSMTHSDLEPICLKHDYTLNYTKLSQWQITIQQCPGLILQIKCEKSNILFGYRAVRALNKEWSSIGQLTTVALLHINHILRQAGKTSVL